MGQDHGHQNHQEHGDGTDDQVGHRLGGLVAHPCLRQQVVEPPTSFGHGAEQRVGAAQGWNEHPGNLEVPAAGPVKG